MDSSSSRVESMKPVVLKAGAALIVSAAGLIFARFLNRREDEQVTSSASNPEISLPGRGAESEEDEEAIRLMEDSQTRYRKDYEHKILCLKARLEELEKKEYEMEIRFLHDCNLKDKEIMLVELKSMVKLEKARLDFFRTEVSTMEEDKKRTQNLVNVYLKLVEKIQCLRSEKGLLQSKAKKLRRKTKVLSCVVKEKNARISGLVAMLFRNLEELETKNKCAHKMEDEIKDLKTFIDGLQQEKKELFSKSNPKQEMEYQKMTVAVEDYNRLVEEYENLKRERADEVKELINMRWSNACLRHALMRYGENISKLDDINENFHQHMSLEDQMALEADEEHHEVEEHHHETSRRKRLLKRLKRLVEGHEKGKSKSEERCFGRHLLNVEPEEEQSIVLARWSCSSV